MKFDGIILLQWAERRSEELNKIKVASDTFGMIQKIIVKAASTNVREDGRDMEYRNPFANIRDKRLLIF